MSVQASCSRCDFTRRFSEELGGKYYRCPKCRKGVIAIPVVDMSESDEVPLRLSSSSFENPFLAVAKRNPPQGMRETMDMTDPGSTAENEAAKPVDAASATDPDLDRPRPQPKMKATLEDASATLREDAPAPPPEERHQKTVEVDVEGEENRGRVGRARRILVECGLCGYFVRIPAEFFGKTVHCPECAGNTIFSESTLDPVKDELLDRLIMETGERRVLFPENEGTVAGESDLDRALARAKKLLGNNALRSFLIGVGLGLIVLMSAYAVVSVKREAARADLVERAKANGWRYATAAGSSDTVFHEPWCSELEGGAGLRVSEDSFKERGAEVSLHDCD